MKVVSACMAASMSYVASSGVSPHSVEMLPDMAHTCLLACPFSVAAVYQGCSRNCIPRQLP